MTGATGEPGEGGVTTYTYTKTYTVKIAPTAVDAERYDGYYPLNGPTTLTVKGSNDEDVTIDFPIPAGKVTLQKYDLTINYKYADGTEAKPTHTESLTYGSSYSVASPLITGYTADKLTVSGSMPDSDVTVDVTFTAKDYTVTYESNGGSTVPSQTVKYNETANKPADPTKSGLHLRWLVHRGEAHQQVRLCYSRDREHHPLRQVDAQLHPAPLHAAHRRDPR